MKRDIRMNEMMIEGASAQNEVQNDVYNGVINDEKHMELVDGGK